MNHTGHKIKREKNSRTVVLLPGVTHIDIQTALAIVSRWLNFEDLGNSIFRGLSENDPSLKLDMIIAKARSGFLVFCEQENVQPTDTTVRAIPTPYQGDPSQDGEYQISVDEFRRFIKTYGIEVTCSLPTSDFANDNASSSSECKSSARASQSQEEKLLSKPLALSASHMGKETQIGHRDVRSRPNTDPDDWGAEFEESFAASKSKETERLKKKRLDQPPAGKLPKTKIGKLVVKIAWEIEVHTGKRAPCKEVMDRLCKLAATVNDSDSIDADVDCLIRADTSVLGQESVLWLTENGDEKPYGQDTCKQTLWTWHKSLPQK